MRGGRVAGGWAGGRTTRTRSAPTLPPPCAQSTFPPPTHTTHTHQHAARTAAALAARRGAPPPSVHASGRAPPAPALDLPGAAAAAAGRLDVAAQPGQRQTRVGVCKRGNTRAAAGAGARAATGGGTPWAQPAGSLRHPTSSTCPPLPPAPPETAQRRPGPARRAPCPSPARVMAAAAPCAPLQPPHAHGIAAAARHAPAAGVGPRQHAPPRAPTCAPPQSTSSWWLQRHARQLSRQCIPQPARWERVCELQSSTQEASARRARGHLRAARTAAADRLPCSTVTSAAPSPLVAPDGCAPVRTAIGAGVAAARGGVSRSRGRHRVSIAEVRRRGCRIGVAALR